MYSINYLTLFLYFTDKLKDLFKTSRSKFWEPIIILIFFFPFFFLSTDKPDYLCFADIIVPSHWIPGKEINCPVRLQQLPRKGGQLSDH